MNIVVCMKPVPDPRKWGKLKLDPRTMLLRRGEVPAVINPLDRNAIEQAIALRSAAGGPSPRSGPSRATSADGIVTVISMAPKDAEEQLAESLAMGCDRAYLLSDPAFAGADSLATARCLAAAIRRLGAVDLVFCGGYSLDGSTSQVGPQVAELLDMPDLTHVTALSVDGSTLRARCAVEDGEAVYDCELPALVTFDKDVNVPRLPSMTGIMRSGAVGVTCWTAADLALRPDEIGLSGSPTQMLNIFAPSLGRKGDMLEGSPSQMAAALVDKLKATRRHAS
ncbi:MAG TPA: electron transfer flavoprotein subunit beta/FixA family protein [Vicinamibacterales bacterium]|jgi:electron transfer flavoprotein beta subunit